MSRERASLRFHDDRPLFREAIRYTASATGFSPRLIEKDYFCSVVLEYLDSCGDDLVFKGGTCLAKVHVGFYRMSEDLDFVLPTPVDARRGVRSRKAAHWKRAVAEVAKSVPGFAVRSELTGRNESLQYDATLEYEPALSDRRESIRVEIGLREPLLHPAQRLRAKSVLLHPIGGSPAAPEIELNCIAFEEAMAEKLRAALTRREPAIRDFYDVDHAVRHVALHLDSPRLIEWVRRKVAIPGNDASDLGPARRAALANQLETELRPVLRRVDFADFDLVRAIALVERVHAALG